MNATNDRTEATRPSAGFAGALKLLAQASARTEELERALRTRPVDDVLLSVDDVLLSAVEAAEEVFFSVCHWYRMPVRDRDRAAVLQLAAHVVVSELPGALSGVASLARTRHDSRADAVTRGQEASQKFARTLEASQKCEGVASLDDAHRWRKAMKALRALLDASRVAGNQHEDHE